MQKWFFSIAMVAGLAIGCTEEQLQRIDRTVSDINNVAAGGKELLESPAGDLLPAQIKIFGVLALALVSGGVNIYQKWRSGIMTKTTKAIVQGIEQAGKSMQTNPSNPIDPIKASIAENMRKMGVFDKGDRLVDQLKIAR